MQDSRSDRNSGQQLSSYGAMALNLTAAAPQDKNLSRWDFAVAHLGYDDVHSAHQMRAGSVGIFPFQHWR